MYRVAPAILFYNWQLSRLVYTSTTTHVRNALHYDITAATTLLGAENFAALL